MKVNRLIVRSLLACIVLTVFGCENDGNMKPSIIGESVTTIRLYGNIESYDMEDVLLSEFVDSVRFIKLETTEESLIKNISKVIFIDEGVIIIDEQDGKILLFDSEGNYVRRISNKGRGNGEYLSITSSNYDSESGILSIYDGLTGKMLLYSLTGDFLKEFGVYNGGVSIIRDVINLPKGHYLCYNKVEYSKSGDYSGLWEIDSEGNFVKNVFRYKATIPSINNLLYSYFQQLPGGVISLRDMMHHDLYHYDGNNIKRYVSYDVEDNKLLKYKGKSYSEERSVFCLTSQEKGNYIISNWIDENGQPFFSLYDKDRTENKFITSFDDSDIEGIWFSKIVDSNVDSFLLIELPGTYIMSRSKVDTAIRQRRILDSLRFNLSEEQVVSMNPVLELLYIKKRIE